MKPSQPYPLHQPTAQASAATTAPPPLPTQWPTQDEEVEVDFRSACNFFTARTSFQFDHSHNVSDAQIKLARVSARASMFRRQAQSYPEGSLLREKRLLQADNEESELLEMQYNSLVKSKALQQKRRIEQTAPQPANKRIRI